MDRRNGLVLFVLGVLSMGREASTDVVAVVDSGVDGCRWGNGTCGRWGSEGMGVGVVGGEDGCEK